MRGQRKLVLPKEKTPKEVLTSSESGSITRWVQPGLRLIEHKKARWSGCQKGGGYIEEPQRPGPPDPAAVGAIMSRYFTDVVRPDGTPANNAQAGP
jgi:hypothetical protein